MEEVQARITAYWEERSASYDDDPDHVARNETEERAWQADLAELLPPPPADLLDVGTGTGFVALRCAALGYRVVGLDPAPGMIARARVAGAALAQPPRFLVGTADQPPLDPESVDVVASRHLLWTLPDPAGTLAAWWRVLRPSGRLVIIDGLWGAGDGYGTAAPDPATEASDPYLRQYNGAVRAALPLLAAQTLDPVVAQVAAAGFGEISVGRLARVEAALARAGVGQAGVLDTRYALTATKGR